MSVAPFLFKEKNCSRPDCNRPEQQTFIPIYDKAADSDALRSQLTERGIDLICDHRKNRQKTKRQDGRKLHCIRKNRWKIERTNSWLHNYGRFTVRKDRLGMMFLGWTQLACLFTVLKRF